MTASPARVQSVPERPANIRRGRRFALLLFGIGLAPFLLATLMYYTGWGIPSGRVNHGSLLQPPVAVAAMGLTRGDGQPLSSLFSDSREQRRWLLLIMAPGCDAGCEHMLFVTHQIQVALGKDAGRLRRALWSRQGPVNADGHPGLLKLRAAPGPALWPGLQGSATGMQLYLVDPHGNVILRYPGDTKGKPVLEDLKRLMKLSRIG